MSWNAWSSVPDQFDAPNVSPSVALSHTRRWMPPRNCEPISATSPNESFGIDTEPLTVNHQMFSVLVALMPGRLRVDVVGSGSTGALGDGAGGGAVVEGGCTTTESGGVCECAVTGNVSVARTISENSVATLRMRPPMGSVGCDMVRHDAAEGNAAGSRRRRAILSPAASPI